MTKCHATPSLGRSDDNDTGSERNRPKALEPSDLQTGTASKAPERAVSGGDYDFVRGAQNFMENLSRQMSGDLPAYAENFRPGREVATTAGQAVYRNRLIELIQYNPTTESVYPEPLLVVPAWIMKNNSLDLSPHNSLIGYLVQQGRTVFCISRHNPGEADLDPSLEDDRRLGTVAARRAIEAILLDQPIRTLSYCIVGTLLPLEAARMAGNGERAFASLTFLATQADIREPGELELFSDESEVSFLDDLMWSRAVQANLLNDPGDPRRSFRPAVMGPPDPCNDPDAWAAQGQEHDGSWWPYLNSWLARRSGQRTDPPSMASAESGYPALSDAMGHISSNAIRPEETRACSGRLSSPR